MSSSQKLFREQKFVEFLDSQAVIPRPPRRRSSRPSCREDRKAAETLIKIANTPAHRITSRSNRRYLGRYLGPIARKSGSAMPLLGQPGFAGEFPHWLNPLERGPIEPPPPAPPRPGRPSRRARAGGAARALSGRASIRSSATRWCVAGWGRARPRRRRHRQDAGADHAHRPQSSPPAARGPPRSSPSPSPTRPAREMKTRVGMMVGQVVEGMPWLGTFPFDRRQDPAPARRAGRPEGPISPSSTPTIRCACSSRYCRPRAIDEKRWPGRVLGQLIDGWKNRGLTPRPGAPRRGRELRQQGQEALCRLSGAPEGAQRPPTSATS